MLGKQHLYYRLARDAVAAVLLFPPSPFLRRATFFGRPDRRRPPRWVPSPLSFVFRFMSHWCVRLGCPATRTCALCLTVCRTFVTDVESRRMRQWVFAALLFIFTAVRLNYTLHLPKGDPLNGGSDFFGMFFCLRLIEKRSRLPRADLDPIVAHLLVCSMLALGSIPFV